MKPRIELLVNELRLHIEKMTDEERAYVINEIKKGYCPECMTNDIPCFCWNGE